MSDSVALGSACLDAAGSPPLGTGPARRVAGLAGAVLGLGVSLIAGADWFWQAVRADGGGMSQWADFPGWQGPAMEVALAAVLAIVFLASVVGVQRTCRALAGHRVQRRLAVIVTLLPTLLLGVGASLGLPKAVAWASDHTAAAHRFAAYERAMKVELRSHPITPRTNAAPAPREVARHLLATSTLGAGWFAGVDPEPSAGAPMLLPVSLTPLSAARTVLVQAHRGDGTTWVFDQTVFEYYWQFRDAATAAAARRYLAAHAATPRRVSPTAVVRVGDQVVQIRVITERPSDSLTPSLQQITRLAVRQASRPVPA